MENQTTRSDGYCQERSSVTLWPILMLLVCVGCGQETNRLAVSGSVSWHGRALERGSIVFVPHAGHRGPKVGAEIVNGRYEIPAEQGPTAGDYRVEVRADTGEYPHAPTDKRRTAKPTKPNLVIPAEYNDRSQLTAVVTRQRRGFDFALPLK